MTDEEFKKFIGFDNLTKEQIFKELMEACEAIDSEYGGSEFDIAGLSGAQNMAVAYLRPHVREAAKEAAELKRLEKKESDRMERLKLRDAGASAEEIRKLWDKQQDE